MEITAAMVKALREKTGLPMMECKKALTETLGDPEAAIEWLRKAGLGQVRKRAERETTEGRIACFVDPAQRRGGIAELRCETAPVANTPDVQSLSVQIAQHAAQLDAPTPASVLEQSLRDNPARKLADLLHDVANRIRENIQVARVGSLRGHLGHYIHHNAQVGVLVEMSADCPSGLKADVCMHIAAMNPPYTRREDVDPTLVETERRLAAEETKGKPPNIVDKIVAGKLNRWFSEIVLLEQPFVKEEKQSVGQFLLAAAPNLTVNRFHRFEVGTS